MSRLFDILPALKSADSCCQTAMSRRENVFGGVYVPVVAHLIKFFTLHPNSARGSIHLGWPLAAWRQSRPNWLEG